MAFEEHARARGLKDKTIAVLLEEDFISIEALSEIRDEDMKDMKITKGQQGLIRKWIAELTNTSNTDLASFSGGKREKPDGTEQVTQTPSTTELSDIEEAETTFTTDLPMVLGAEDTSTTDLIGVKRAEVPSTTELSGAQETEDGACAQDPICSSQRPTSTTQKPPKATLSRQFLMDISHRYLGYLEGQNLADITRGLDDETRQEVEEYIKEHGVHNVSKFLAKKLEKHKNMKINIAITGQSGKGKSSFINCVRNQSAHDPGAAKTGRKETTTQIQQYSDPRNEMLIYWDLPGMGTPKFLKENYLETVGFDNFDFFVIVTCERFQEDDLYLAKQVHVRGKQFIFLRTKVDQDIDSDKRDNPDQHNADTLIAELRHDCEKNLKLAKLPSDNIFLISNFLENRTRFDFPKLMETIVKEAPCAKKTSLILSLTACSEQAIEVKREALQERIPLVASRAVSFKDKLKTVFRHQEDCVKEEMEMYRDQFGLKDNDIQKMGVDKSKLSTTTTNVLEALGNSVLALISKMSRVPISRERIFASSEQIQQLLHKALEMCATAAKEIIQKSRDR